MRYKFILINYLMALKFMFEVVTENMEICIELYLISVLNEASF